jgi:hypothetical protein
MDISEKMVEQENGGTSSHRCAKKSIDSSIQGLVGHPGFEPGTKAL